MKSIKNKIEELKQINLESFDIDTLVAMQSEIKSKQNNLFEDILIRTAKHTPLSLKDK